MKFFKNIFRAWGFFFFKLAHNGRGAGLVRRSNRRLGDAALSHCPVLGGASGRARAPVCLIKKNSEGMEKIIIVAFITGLLLGMVLGMNIAEKFLKK